MFKFFEKLVPALDDTEPVQPPNTLLAFCLHYTQGYKVALCCMTILTALLAILEVSLFGFMGQLVDWLTTKDPHTLFQEEGMTLLLMGGLIVIVIPLLTLLHSLIIHQVLLGNYPMSIRWFAHRYLLKQSIS